MIGDRSSGSAWKYTNLASSFDVNRRKLGRVCSEQAHRSLHRAHPDCRAEALRMVPAARRHCLYQANLRGYPL